MPRRGRPRPHAPAGSPALSAAPPPAQSSDEHAADSAWAERFAHFVNTDPGELAAQQRDRELAGFERDAARTPLHLGRGPIGLGGLARAALLVAPDPDDPSGARRVLAATKPNLGPMAPALAYRVVTAPNGAAAIRWEGPVQLTATDLVSPRSGRDPARSEAILEAQAILASILADGPLSADVVRREALQAGVGPGILWKAKASLGIRSQKIGQPGQPTQRWVWALPQPTPGPAEESCDSPHQNTDNLR